MLELAIEMGSWFSLLPIAGVLGIGGSKSSSQSTVAPDILELIKGIFSDADPQVRKLALEALGTLRGEQGRGITEGFDFNSFLQSSDIGQELQRTILNPSFSPTTKGEQSLIGGVRDQILGSTALKGLKPTTSAITQGLAPSLMKLRQNKISNLTGAFQQELGGRGQDVTQRGQTIQGSQNQIDSVLNNFLSLLSLGRQTPVVRGGGAQSTADSFSVSGKFS